MPMPPPIRSQDNKVNAFAAADKTLTEHNKKEAPGLLNARKDSQNYYERIDYLLGKEAKATENFRPGTVEEVAKAQMREGLDQESTITASSSGGRR